MSDHTKEEVARCVERKNALWYTVFTNDLGAIMYFVSTCDPHKDHAGFHKILTAKEFYLKYIPCFQPDQCRQLNQIVDKMDLTALAINKLTNK